MRIRTSVSGPSTSLRPGLAAAAGLLALFLLAPRLGATADTLPASISDKDFWALTEQLSEPNGTFRSDNLLSNETTLSTVAAALAARVKPGGVYLGVGPEQNFTYIAAIRPRIAIITDVRRGNLHLHLMYKALFEMSDNRADFVARLFTRKRPEGLSDKSTGAELMNAISNAPAGDAEAYAKNLQAISDHLMKKHGFPLPAEDLAGIDYVYGSFYRFGPGINYSSSTSGSGGRGVTYATLMMTTDTASGQERSYLATEAAFAFLKTLESKNLVVPVVGDFSGPKALRAVGAYLKDRGAIVTAFYLSNVEQYLSRGGVWPAFCANVAMMPLDETSTFIRPNMGGRGSYVLTMQGTAGAGGTSTTTTLNGVPFTGAWQLSDPSGRGIPFGAIAAETAGCTAK